MWYLSVRADQEAMETVCTGRGIQRVKAGWSSGVKALSCISWGLKLLKPQAQLCSLLRSSGSPIKIKSSPFFTLPLSFGPERNECFKSVEETWGFWAPRAAAAAAAVQHFKVLLLDIRAGGESKENRSYSLLEPAVAFHTDDSSIFLSPYFSVSFFFFFFFLLHGVVKLGGWEGVRVRGVWGFLY